MSHTVFANNREISSKASDGKSICAFPDVCLSPPSPPAGPIPIPYPNTGMASDTTSGSRTVKIGGKEVMLKDRSYYKSSTGDEAATRSLGMGVITHTITGKVYFTSWSMDVKFEGENVVRHLDLTTHNHNPSPGNGPPWPHTASMTAAFAPGGKCAGMEHLRLQQYKEPCPDNSMGERQTGHHLIPGRCLRDTPDYNHGEAPVICVSFGNQHQGTHKACHARFDPVEQQHFDTNTPFTYDKAKSTAAASAGGAQHPNRELTQPEKDCVAHQLDSYYAAKPPAGPGCTGASPMRASGAPGKVAAPPASPAPSGTV